jgi:hypothetical protein
MAKYFGLGSAEPTEDSERTTARALRTLGNDWIVVHHVSWQSKRNRRQGDGEADFIVLHPRIGLLVVEVKGGGVEVNKGRWQSTDRHGVVHDINNPYEQAIASKHALVSWLEQRNLAGRVRVGHAVVFPHLGDLPYLGPAASTEITFTRNNFSSFEAAIVRCMKHWDLRANLSDSEVDTIVNLLAPTIKVRQMLAEKSASAQSQLIELSAGQVAAYSGLRAARGGLILGSAGTGKTVLAIARAAQLRSDGFSTLLLCYNEILAEQLAAHFCPAEGIKASTFHSLCFYAAKKAKVAIPSEPDRIWWESGAADLLVEAFAMTGETYDAIVIDEAQDFAPNWIDALKLLLSNRAEAPFYAFADPRQDVWNRKWIDVADGQFTFALSRNLRNTHPIAQKVAAVFGDDLRAPFGVDGPSPKWRDIRDPKYPQADVIAVVEHLIDEGFGPSNLVILCSSAVLVAHLRQESVGPYSFGRWGSQGIPVETIARFKGMEAEAVVLVLNDIDLAENRTIAYVGLSRPRSVLYVVANPKIQNLLNWVTPVS